METVPKYQIHLVPGISFDADRLALRQKTIGASEIGAVAGLNPYKSPFDLWLEKTGQVPPFSGNQFTEWGLRMEQPIADKYAEVTGLSLQTVDTIVRDSDSSLVDHSWMSCTPDRIVFDGGMAVRGLEIKRFGEHRAEEFGVAGTDEVPNEVAAQCQWSMLITGMRAWDLAVLLGQADFRIYSLAYNEVIADGLYELGADFWFNAVLPNVPPKITAGSATSRFLQQAFPTHSAELLDATPEQVEMAQALARAKADIKALEFDCSGYEAQLKLAIGEHAGIRGVATWKAPKSGFVKWKEVAEALVRKHGLPRADIDALIAEHTGEPSRRFLLSKGV